MKKRPVRTFKNQQKKSVVRSLRSGNWFRPTFSWTVVLASASVLGDILTTSYIYLSPGFAELNPSMAYLEQFSVEAGLMVFFFVSFLKLSIVLLSLSWLSEAVAVHAVFTNGLATVSNLVLFWTGFSLLATTGFEVSAQAANVASIFGALALVYRWQSDILEVMAVGGLALLVALVQLYSFV